MSKRSYAEFSLGSAAALVQHAETLLKAAQSFKRSIEAGKEADSTMLENAIDAILPEIQYQKTSTTSRRSQKSTKSEDKANPESIHIPQPMLLTGWSPSTNTQESPPLPPILDSRLARAALTHSGCTKAGEMSYERLEWLGDAYLYLISTALIYQTFPELPAGRCSQYRESLVKNMTLSKYTTKYELDRRSRFPPEYGLEDGKNGHSANDKAKKKVLGDIFESYVAGVVLGDPENGLSDVCTFVKALWSQELAHEISSEFRAESRRSELSANGNQSAAKDSATSGSNGGPGRAFAAQTDPGQLEPKVQLARAIGAKGILIAYKDEGEPKKEKKSGLPWYTVGAYLNGWGETNLRLGVGSAFSKREAGAKAATAALENKKQMKTFEQKKKDHMDALRAQQDRDEQAAATTL